MIDATGQSNRLFSSPTCHVNHDKALAAPPDYHSHVQEEVEALRSPDEEASTDMRSLLFQFRITPITLQSISRA